MFIREMIISDYEEANELWLNTPGMGLRSLDDSKQGIEKFLKRNPTTNFVALNKNNQIKGIILCGHDGRRGYIYHTAVDKKYQQNGIGKSLVNTALEALKAEGINKVALVVFKNNDSGNKFWNVMGFEERNDLYYCNKGLNQKNI
jgi:N-acetylglutamate synthase